MFLILQPYVFSLSIILPLLINHLYYCNEFIITYLSEYGNMYISIFVILNHQRIHTKT